MNISGVSSDIVFGEDHLPTSRDCDVIVVGAGLSGLTAAYWLKKRSADRKPLDVVVVEAGDRVGGRLLTIPLKAAQGKEYFDIGGRWVGTAQKDMMELINDLGLEVYRQYNDGKQVLQLGSEKQRVVEEPNKPNKFMNPVDSMDNAVVLSRIDKLSKQVPIRNPFASTDAVDLDGMTVEEMVRKVSVTQFVRDLFEALCLCHYGVTANQVSALFFLAQANSFGGLEKMLEATEDGDMGQRIKGGAQGVCKQLAVEIGNEAIYLNSTVQIIIQHHKGVTVLAKTGFKFEAQRLIMAIPPAEISKINFEPQLPLEKRRFLNSCIPGSTPSFVVTYSTPFWRFSQFSGQIVASGLRTDEKDKPHPVIWAMDSTSENENPAIFGVLNQEWASVSSTDRRDAVIEDLARAFGEEAEDYLEYHDKDWFDERHIGGVAIHVPPGNMKYYIAGVRKPFDKIHWAGTETSTRYMGNMAGAVKAGKRAALEVIYNIDPDSITEAEVKGTFYAKRRRQPLIPRRGYTTFLSYWKSDKKQNRTDLTDMSVDISLAPPKPNDEMTDSDTSDADEENDAGNLKERIIQEGSQIQKQVVEKGKQTKSKVSEWIETGQDKVKELLSPTIHEESSTVNGEDGENVVEKREVTTKKVTYTNDVSYE